MSWSLKIGRIAGIPLQLHWTFIVWIVGIGGAQLARGAQPAQVAQSVGLVLALFGCVLLHELGHALAARRYGVATSDITLLPIGGVARLQRIPERPSEELVVALAGPAVNIAIAGVLLLAGVRLGTGLDDPEHLVRADFWPRLLEVNLFLALFNLLPAFPMDGGRVLRALLAMRLPYDRATRAAASVGQFMAMLFGLLGLITGNFIILFIALFVWIGAEGEASQVEERLILKDIPVRAAMLTEYHALQPNDTLGRAADLLLAGTQHDFPVLAHDGSNGVLTRADLLNGLAAGGRDATVASHTRTPLDAVEADSLLAPAVALLREGGVPCLQVVERGRPVGLLSLENVGEYLMVRTALATAGARSGSPRPGPLVP
ncbi:MAG: site-2 protease family protein [Thermoleophilia bacterium]|nr:site-2 protease family protein [Thermoleophilia bacterium]